MHYAERKILMVVVVVVVMVVVMVVGVVRRAETEGVLSQTNELYVSYERSRFASQGQQRALFTINVVRFTELEAS